MDDSVACFGPASTYSSDIAPMLDVETRTVVITRNMIWIKYTLAPALKESTSASSTEQRMNEGQGGAQESEQSYDSMCKCSGARKRGVNKRSELEAGGELLELLLESPESFSSESSEEASGMTALGRTPNPRRRLELLVMAAIP